MKIVWNKVTWYSRLLAAILFIFLIPLLAFYFGRDYQSIQQIDSLSIDTIITFKWPTIDWKQYVSSASRLSFEYPSTWTIMEDKVYEDKTTSAYSYPSILVCPPDYQSSLTPKDGSPNNCIEFIEENGLTHPLPNDDVRNFKYFSEFMSTTEYPGYPDYYDANMMLDLSNYYIGFKRTGDRFTGLQQTTCLPGQTTQCILIFRHVLDSIDFTK